MQLSPSSSAAEEVVNQLGHWGNYASMRLFYQSIQALVRGGGAACSEGLQARVKFWLSARASLAQVSVNMKCTELLSLLNQACLDDHKLPLTRHRLQCACHSCMTCTAMGEGLDGTFYSINQFAFCVLRTHQRSQQTVKFLRMLSLDESNAALGHTEVQVLRWAASLARHVMHMLTSLTTRLSRYAGLLLHAKCT